MEVQPEVEPRNEEQMDCERECAEDEWKSWQRVRNTLHLVSAVAQWILLLACLIYLGIDFLRPSTRNSAGSDISAYKPYTPKRAAAQEGTQDNPSSTEKTEPQSNEVPWTHIRYSGKSIKGVAINLTAERGSIQIRNGSIMIPCDGLYLVSLNGSIYPEEKLLKLTLENTQKSISSVLWIQTVQSSDNTVNFTTVFFLFRDDYVTLCTSSNANISGLSLSLVLVSPPEETLCRS